MPGKVSVAHQLRLWCAEAQKLVRVTVGSCAVLPCTSLRLGTCLTILFPHTQAGGTVKPLKSEFSCLGAKGSCTSVCLHCPTSVGGGWRGVSCLLLFSSGGCFASAFDAGCWKFPRLHGLTTPRSLLQKLKGKKKS